MALNLSDLTGASTSGDILAEAQTTADFLDSVPLLKNLADSSGATNAKQFTATNQPTALPLVDNEGYCYLPPVIGNYVSTPDSSELDITGDITIECDFIVPEFPVSANSALVGKYNTDTKRSYLLYIQANGNLGLNLSQNGNFSPSWATTTDFSSVLSGKTRATVKVTWRQSDGRVQFFIKANDGSFTQVGVNQTIAITNINNSTQEVEIGTTNSGSAFRGSSIGVFGARIYASVDGTDKRLDIDFTSPRIPHGATKFTCETGQVVTVNTSGNNPAKIIKKPVLRFDGSDDGFKGFFDQTITEGGYAFAAFSVLGDGGDNWARVLSFNPTGGDDYQNGGAIFITKNNDTNNLSLPTGVDTGMFDDANGDILAEAGRGTNYRKSRVNDASVKSQVAANTMLFDEFNVGAVGSTNAAIDLEYLAFFPATLTDKQADQVRNYINNRNNVFYRWDTDGYYFFDPQKATFVGDFSASNTLDGYIIGSDKGDTDVRSDLTLEQAVIGNAQPSTDGYTITFSDNAEFLNFTNGASQSLAGWQIVGTSLGTFAYKVDADAITELNLLGNLGGSAYRKAGDLYGIILLPETATNRDIEAARQLLISRGAADGVTATNLANAWRERADIVEFGLVNTSNVSDLSYAWYGCTSLTSFPLINTSNVSDFLAPWYNCNSLTSFPLIDTSNASNLRSAWYGCTSLTSFPLINTSNVSSLRAAWYGCNSLNSFPAGMFDSWNPASIVHDVFYLTWKNCTSLTPQSVENILVSIAASGKYATTSGASGGTALTDPEIDIDYDGSGLTAATLTAIESLNGRGWRVKINGEIIVPNILQLQPAAAYSLRSFDADADPNVVNVRRSSDGATSDFTASEVSDGTLTSWVNTEYNLYTSDFSAGEDGWSGFGATVLGNQDAVSDGTTSKDDCLKITSTTDDQSWTQRNNGVVAGKSYRVTGEAYVPSSNTAYDSIAIKDGIVGGDSSFPSGQIVSNGSWVSFSFEYTATVSGTQRLNLCKEGVPIINTIAGSNGDVGYIRNLNFTQLTADGYVTTWYDQSGNDNHTTQVTASSQPKIVSSGSTILENGKAAIQWDGVDDELNFFGDISATEVSSVIVAKAITHAINDRFFGWRNSSFSFLNVLIQSSDSTLLRGMSQTNSSDQQLLYSGVDYTNNSLISMYNASIWRINGDEFSGADVSGATGVRSTNGLALGSRGDGNNNANVQFQEAIFYSNNQSANRTGIEKNINDHYSIY